MKTSNPIGVILLCFILCNQLAAQERQTVLLNTNASKSFDFKFKNTIDTNTFSLGIKGAKLHLWVASNKLDERQRQSFKLYENKGIDNETSIGVSGNIIQGVSELRIPLNIKNGLTLDLKCGFTTKYPEEKIMFNNSNISSDAFLLNKQPKLVLNYEVSREPFGSEWNQLSGNAQHNSRLDWFNGEYGSNFKYQRKEIYKDAKKSIKYMSIFKSKPIIFGKDVHDKPFVAMLTGEIGNKTLWQIPLDALPAKQPVIGPDGKMLFVSEKNVLEVLDLNKKADSIHVQPSRLLTSIIINIANKDSISVNNLANVMTVGYDGTIYMPITNKGGKAGIVALSAYPSLKPRWFYNTANAVGPVSLSDDEKMAFFLETDSATTKSRLVILDNIDGSVLALSKDILGTYADKSGNSHIPPVVLQTVHSDTTGVYVLDGYKTSNKLFVFKVNYKQLFNQKVLQKKANDIDYFKLIESKDTKNKGLSLPTVFNNEKVYFMNYNTLKRYHINSNSVVDGNTFIKDESSNDNVQLFCHKSSGNNVFLFIQNGNRLFYSYKEESSKSSRSVSAPMELNFNANNLVQVNILPNLGLCALDNGEIIHYYSINPIFTDDITYIDEIKHKHTYTKKQISVKTMTVPKNTLAILVGTQISISSGFIVKKGAELTFQIRK